MSYENWVINFFLFCHLKKKLKLPRNRLKCWTDSRELLERENTWFIKEKISLKWSVWFTLIFPLISIIKISFDFWAISKKGEKKIEVESNKLRFNRAFLKNLNRNLVFQKTGMKWGFFCDLIQTVNFFPNA